MHIVKLLIFICIMNTCQSFSAASSSSLSLTGEQTSGEIAITIAGNIEHFDRNILMQMPYFRARLTPALYMRAIPNYRQFLPEITEVLKSEAQKNTFNLTEETDFDNFNYLYRLIEHVKQNNTISVEEILPEIQATGYATAERIRPLIKLAQKLLTTSSIFSLFDQYVGIMMQRKLLSTNGTIAKAFFAPQENLLQTILALIKAEKKNIRVACYRMTNPAIICELAQAVQRRVGVTVIVDEQDTKEKEIKDMEQAGLHVCLWKRRWFEGTHPKMHNKFFIFTQNIEDKPLLITGSANCTWLAQEVNEENIVVLNDQKIIGKFGTQFDQLSSPFFSKNIWPRFWEEAYTYVYKECLTLNALNLNQYTPYAYPIFQALMRLYAMYVKRGLLIYYTLNTFESPQGDQEYKQQSELIRDEVLP